MLNLDLLSGGNVDKCSVPTVSAEIFKNLVALTHFIDKERSLHYFFLLF